MSDTEKDYGPTAEARQTQGDSGPSAPVIGGKRIDEMSKSELVAALKERLAVNVALVQQNTDLQRKLADTASIGEWEPDTTTLSVTQPPHQAANKPTHPTRTDTP